VATSSDAIRKLSMARRNAWLLLLSLVAGIAGAQAVTVLTPPTYQATTTVLVTGGTESVEQLYVANITQDLMPTIARIAESRKVATAAAKAMGLPARHVVRHISADTQEKVQILTLTADAPTAARAADIANAATQALLPHVAGIRHDGMGSLSAKPLDKAKAPSRPVSPRPILNGLLGALLGSLVGIGLARLRTLTDDKVRGVDELREATGAPVLGSIPYDPKVPREPLIVHRPNCAWSEAFARLRTNMEFVDVDSPPRLVAVTSPLPKEGKSNVVCNLAVAMARAGRRVLLVEADLRRPRSTQYLGLAGAEGLTTVLSGNAELAEVVQQLDEDGPMFLSAGPLPPNPGELLASDRCRHFLLGLRECYDVVLLDLPPLLPVADAGVLAGLADGTIVVARYSDTRTRQLRRTLEALTTVNARFLGCVLNMAPSQSESYGYRTDAMVSAEALLPSPSRLSRRRTGDQVNSG
jgi:capsular exopolysaccharide synthesis family protein